MTTLSTFSRLATVAVAALLLAPIHNAQAKGGGRMAFGAVTTGTNQPGPSPVVSTRDHRGGATTPRRADTPSYGNGSPIVRDHRRKPVPWSLPPHWHRH